jgi:hypothetical protein
MAANLKIWDTYIAPAIDTGMSLGSSVYRFNELYLGGSARFHSLIYMYSDIVLDTTTGTKFGTTTSEKLSFYGVTPIVQPIATTDLGTVLSNLGLRAIGTAYPITTSGAINFTGNVTIYSPTGSINVSTFTTTDITIDSLALSSGISGVGGYSLVLADADGKLVRDKDVSFDTDTLYISKLDISANPTAPKIYEQEIEPVLPDNTFAFWYDTSSGIDETYLILNRSGVQKKVILT